jgi:hypothetical protein
MAKKGDWVQIHSVLMEPENRSTNLPKDTKKVPLEIRFKGFLQEDAEIGSKVTVLTRTGRVEVGTLVETKPYYAHSFGTHVPELMQVSEQVREILFGGEDNA